MGLKRYDASSEPGAMSSALEQDGAVVIRDLPHTKSVAPAGDELAKWLSQPYDQSPMGNNPFTGMQTLRTSGLIAKSPGCRLLATDPTVLKVVDQTLGSLCSRFQLSFTQAIKIGPGQPAQPLHRDTTMYPLKRPGPEVFVNVIWAHSDFTEENGATRFILGSHLWDDSRRPGKEDAIVQATMNKGDAVVYYGSVLHGGGANTSTDAIRLGLAFGYTLGWLRQEENQYLAVPPELAKTFPASLQRLLGYAEHFPFIGWHEGQDHDVFRGGEFKKKYDAGTIRGGESKSLTEILTAGVPEDGK